MGWSVKTAKLPPIVPPGEVGKAGKVHAWKCLPSRVLELVDGLKVHEIPQLVVLGDAEQIADFPAVFRPHVGPEVVSGRWSGRLARNHRLRGISFRLLAEHLPAVLQARYVALMEERLEDGPFRPDFDAFRDEQTILFGRELAAAVFPKCENIPSFTALLRAAPFHVFRDLRPGIAGSVLSDQRSEVVVFFARERTVA